MKKGLLLAFACLTIACQAQNEYQLQWSDEFDGTELNTDYWNIEENARGGGNAELQYYTPRNVSIEKHPISGEGCLVLSAKKEDYGNRPCTSARLHTQGKVTAHDGKVEARIAFPYTADGLWPAFWMLGDNLATNLGNNDDVDKTIKSLAKQGRVVWPKCGEIDICEMGHHKGIESGTQDRYFNGALHLGSAWNTVWSDAQDITYHYSVEDTFHIITMEWTPTSITMYMDKDANPGVKPYFQANLEPNNDDNYNREKVFGKPNFIIANLAVGGNFPQIWDINQISALADGPRSMYIDWIRIYQQGTSKETFVSPSPSDDIEPECGTDVENVTISQPAQKVVQNGQIYILKDGQLYNIIGQPL